MGHTSRRVPGEMSWKRRNELMEGGRGTPNDDAALPPPQLGEDDSALSSAPSSGYRSCSYFKTRPISYDPVPPSHRQVPRVSRCVTPLSVGSSSSSPELRGRTKLPVGRNFGEVSYVDAPLIDS